MKFLKNTIISLLTALATVMLVFGGYTIYAEDPANFRDADVNFEQASSAYHSEMNKFFDSKIEQFNDLIEEENYFTREEFQVPTTKKKGLDIPDPTGCKEENVSTYCTAIQAMEIYLEYVRVLDRMSGELVGDIRDATFETILLETNERNEKLNAEYDIAKTAMEGTLAAFNEYHMAAPVHKQYLEVIEKLTVYKLTLKDLRQETVEFPVRFVDATSSQCE